VAAEAFTRYCLGLTRGASRSHGAVAWPLHNIATANIVWCMAYIKGVGWGSYIEH